MNTDSYRSDEWILNMFSDYFDPCPLNDKPNIDGLNIKEVFSVTDDKNKPNYNQNGKSNKRISRIKSYIV